MKVLLDDPKEKGIDLYDEMKKFYATRFEQRTGEQNWTNRLLETFQDILFIMMFVHLFVQTVGFWRW